MIWRRDDARDDTEAGESHDRPRGEIHEGSRREAHEGVRRMAEQGSEVTIVGQGAKLEGTVVSAGSLRIDGQVKGQINADGDVMLSPQSQVEADIRAQNVSVAGRFKGSIVVKGRAEISRGGRVDGNVTSKTLVIEDGAIFQGQSIMDQQAQASAQAAAAQAAQGAAKGETQPAEEGAKV